MFTVGASFNYLVSNKESLIDPFGQSIFTGDPRLQFENYFFDARLGVGYLFGKSWKVSGLFEYGLSPIRLYKNTFGPPLADNNQYSALYQFNLTYFF